MNDMNKKEMEKIFILIETHIRSIETLINKIPLKNGTATYRKQSKIKLAELEREIYAFKHWSMWYYDNIWRNKKEY